MLCDNATTCGRAIFMPRCFNSPAEYVCRVAYERWGDPDVLYLCRECRNALMREARRYRCRFHSTRIKGV